MHFTFASTIVLGTFACAVQTSAAQHSSPTSVTRTATSGDHSRPTSWTTTGSWSSGDHGTQHGNHHGGGRGQGWGSKVSTGSWSDGPWTSWWDDGDCPAATWSGWTKGSDASRWTTWTGCTASTTATNVYTTTITASNGTVETVTSTGYGVKVAEKTTGSGSSSGAAPAFVSSVGLVVSAAVALGTLLGALLL